MGMFDDGSILDMTFEDMYSMVVLVWSEFLGQGWYMIFNGHE